MDYSKLEFNPLDLGEDEMIWERYPELQNNPIFCSLTNDDYAREMTPEALSLLVSFVILYVDANSPQYKITDLEKRISGCANALDIKKGSVVMSEIEIHSSTYSKILYEYFKMQNSILFESWLSLKTTLSELYKYLRTPISFGDDADMEADKRSRVQQRITPLEKEILQKEAKLFPNKNIQDLVNRENINEQLSGYPERFAQYHPMLKK